MSQEKLQINLGSSNSTASCTETGDCNDVCAAEMLSFEGELRTTWDTSIERNIYTDGHCGDALGPDVIRGFTAPQDGTYFFEIESDFVASLHVYEGLCAGTELTCDNFDFENEVVVDLSAGDSIGVVVSGQFPGEFGESLFWARAVPVDALEGNDSVEDAATLLADGVALENLSISPSGDQDFFALSTKAGWDYTIRTDVAGTDCLALGEVSTQLQLYAADGVTLLQSWESNVGGGGRCSRVQFTAPADETVFIRVATAEDQAADPDARGSYSLVATETAP